MKNPLTGLMGVFGSPSADPELEGTAETNDSDSLLTDVENARLQWLNAKAYFDHVTDPDLVDMAIYSIEAAEKRYMYLLKVARTRGVRLGPVSSN